MSASNARIERHNISFSSGNTAYAHGGVVGLSPDLRPSQGWDGGFDWLEPGDQCDDGGLTNADMIELADLMIDRWTRFKAKLEGGNLGRL